MSYGAGGVPGSRSAVCMDASSHCRTVDDSKLLTKNVTDPDGCHKLPAVHTITSPVSDTTSPKVADVHRSNNASLQTNTSLQPLLTSRSEIRHQAP